MTAVEFFAVFMAAVCIALALTGLSYRLAEWNARLEEQRRRRDAASFFAQLAAMTDAEVRAWQDWQNHCETAGIPLGDNPTAQRIADQIAENEARRFSADEALRRWSA
jgi:hypothetical protein